MRHIKHGLKWIPTELKFKREIPQHWLNMPSGEHFLKFGDNSIIVKKYPHDFSGGFFRIICMGALIQFDANGKLMIMTVMDENCDQKLCNIDFKENNDIMELAMEILNNTSPTDLEK